MQIHQLTIPYIVPHSDYTQLDNQNQGIRFCPFTGLQATISLCQLPFTHSQLEIHTWHNRSNSW